MSKAGKVLLVVGTVAVVAAVVVVFVFLRDDKSYQSESSDTVTTVSTEMFTEEDAQYLEEKLNSSSQEEQKLAFVPMMQAAEWDSDALFPEGAVLEVDYTSFEGDDENGYTVQSSAVRDGEVIDMYTLQVVYVESKNAWLVSTTTRIEGE